MRLLIVCVVVCCVLFERIHSRPDGPPSEACRNLIPQHPDSLDSDLGYVLLAPDVMIPGRNILVTLFGSLMYRGIFLQVRDSPDLATGSAVGSWEDSVVPGFFRIIDCSGEGFPLNSALGHASRVEKTAAQGFEWTPPDCVDGQQYFIIGTVVRNFTFYQTGFLLPITCSVEPNTTTTTPQPFFVSTTSSISPATTTESTTTPFVCQYSDLNSVPENYTNDFEDSTNVLKGWRIITSAEGGSYRWTLGRGPTPSLATGPGKAYEGNGFVYTEASFPAQPGDRSALITNQDLRGCFCIEFAVAFNVFGEGHSLSVDIGGANLGTITEPFSNWSLSSIQVDTPNFVGIRVMATRGSTWLGDMALDDVRIFPGMC